MRERVRERERENMNARVCISAQVQLSEGGSGVEDPVSSESVLLSSGSVSNFTVRGGRFLETKAPTTQSHHKYTLYKGGTIDY